jgi:FAD/FMN-containing dehydrogenase
MASLVNSLVNALTGNSDSLCSVLADHGFQVEYPLSLSYAHDLTNYWSAACSDLHPECMVAPKNAQEMSDVITALGYTQDQFAVKSGGHSPNLGFSSTQGGLLIVTKNLDQVVYDPSTQTAVVGPGQRWEDVQGKLEGTGRAVVGGRLGGVGVGGLLLGGES